MRVLLCFIILGALNGCIVLGGDSPPQHTTVVVPPGSTVTCVNLRMVRSGHLYRIAPFASSGRAMN